MRGGRPPLEPEGQTKLFGEDDEAAQDTRVAVPVSHPHAPGSDTSRAAAAAQKLKAKLDNDKILGYIRKQGAKGATADQVTAALGLNPLTCGARVSELCNRYNVIRDSERRRPTRTGSKARVYVAIVQESAVEG